MDAFCRIQEASIRLLNSEIAGLCGFRPFNSSSIYAIFDEHVHISFSFFVLVYLLALIVIL